MTLEGGTHNPFAPPWDFLDKAFLPLLNRMGPTVTTHLERYGFYPAGGGRFTVEIAPVQRLEPIEIMERGERTSRCVRALVANLPVSIANRETGVLLKKLGMNRDECHSVTVDTSAGRGNILMFDMCFDQLTEVFTGFGQKGVSAEKIADAVADEVRSYLRTDAPVGPHLADQLLVPMALAGQGRFRTVKPSSHTTTNAEVLKMFMGLTVEMEEDGDGVWEVIVHRKGATPVGTGVLGIIPGSMGTPGYVVRGRGEPESLNSASHGAGRKMSRKKAKEAFSWDDARRFLAEHNAELISAGLDEVPMAYKDIDQVMDAQADLVEKVACFEPRLVKMASLSPNAHPPTWADAGYLRCLPKWAGG